MDDRDRDIATLLEDVKTIKSILQNEDAAFPRVWRVMWTAASAILVAGLLQYFLPFFRNLDVDGRILWLWVPGFCLIFPVVIAILYAEIRRTGTRFLGQGRFRHLMFARFVIPPAGIVLMWVSSRNTQFSVEGIFLLIVAMWQTAIEQALPHPFRLVPLLFMTLGLVELGFHITGPETTLFNVALVAGAIAFAGFLFWARDRGR